MPTFTFCLQCEVDDVFNPDVRVGLRGRLDRVFPERKLPQLALEGERRGFRGQYEEMSRHALLGLRRRGQVSMRVNPCSSAVPA